MIIRQLYKTRSDGVRLYKSYSDEGKMLLQNETGNKYEIAIDVENAPYTYTEIDGNEIPAEEALKIITGGGGGVD